MFICGRQYFLTLPKGTLFSRYMPSIFQDLCIKKETIYDKEQAIDFYYVDLVSNIECSSSDEQNDILSLAERYGSNFSFEYAENRDGMFDGKGLFVVYTKEDTKKLIDVLLSTFLNED